jgi:hypothetical protein
MKKAKFFFLSLIILFSSVSFCNAADVTSTDSSIDIVKIKQEVITVAVKFWNEIGRPAWNGLVVWYNDSVKPWLEENTSQQTKDEFSKEAKEVVGEAPSTIKSIWDKILELVK